MKHFPWGVFLAILLRFSPSSQAVGSSQLIEISAQALIYDQARVRGYFVPLPNLSDLGEQRISERKWILFCAKILGRSWHEFITNTLNFVDANEWQSFLRFHEPDFENLMPSNRVSDAWNYQALVSADELRRNFRHYLRQKSHPPLKASQDLFRIFRLIGQVFMVAYYKEFKIDNIAPLSNCSMALLPGWTAEKALAFNRDAVIKVRDSLIKNMLIRANR